MELEQRSNSGINTGLRYVVITPVRDEAEFIEQTIHSMVSQSVKPCIWIIVNDGSTDGTEQIVQTYLAHHPWIKLVNRKDRGFRQRGGGVIRAFYDGFAALPCHDYEFIVKLDGDISFEPTYFEQIWAEFAARPKLGIAGGDCYIRSGEDWILEGGDAQHVRGGTKVYRLACFEAIGGLVSNLGWDGIDEWKARLLGWETMSFPSLKVLHYRPMGAGTGRLKGRIEAGRAAYFMSYHPLFMLVRGVRRMVDSPYVLGGLAMLWGYFGDWLKGREQVNDPVLIRFLRQEQLKRLRLVRARSIGEGR